MKQNFKSHKTRNAFVASLMAVILCVAMLVGTTFAWFTDSVTSGKNTITAGNLDIEVYHKDKTTDGYEKVTSETMLFDDVTLWEPGAVCYENIKVTNEGTLALKYLLSLNVSDKNTLNGHDLSEVIKVAVKEGGFDGDREAAKSLTGYTTLASFQKNGTLDAKNGTKDSEIYGVVLYWEPTDSDNTWNANNGQETSDNKALNIAIGINVNATQLTSESDSFDNTYDAGAPWMGGTDDDGLAANTDTEKKTVTIATAEQLASFAKAVNGGTEYKGYTVTLEKDIDLNDIPWTPINAGNWGMTFDGNEKAILNLNVSGEKNVGLFGTFTGNTMKDLTVDGAVVTGINHVAVLSGDGLCAHFDKCTVKNATVTAKVANDDDGDKAGAITGYLSPEPSASITNCTVEGCTIQGYRDVGSVVGYVNNNKGAGGATVTGNTATNVSLVNDRSNNYKNYTTDAAFDVNDIIGELTSNNTVNNNTATNITKTIANCDHSTVASYTISGNTLSINCTCGSTVEATEAQLTKLAGKVFVKNGETYELKDDLTTAVNDSSSSSVEVWLTSGTYTLAGINKNVTVNELTGAEAVITSYSVTSENKKSYYGVSGNVTINNCTMQGSMDYNDGWYLGIQATSLTCNNCAFIGKQTAYSATMTCNNCTFDCTGITTKVDYAIYCYNASSIFKNCSFTGCGKAVKIYSESSSLTGVYNFENCTFTQVPITNGAEASNKAAIQIDSTYVNGYTVNITSCTQTGFTALWNDTGTKSTVNVK